MIFQLSRNRDFWLGALLFYMVFILAMSIKPPATQAGPSTPLTETVHNLCHIPAYAGLTFLLVAAMFAYGITSAVFLRAFCLSVLYGGCMELLQGFVPGRTPSLLDMFLNVLGTTAMILIIRRWLLKEFFNTNVIPVRPQVTN